MIRLSTKPFGTLPDGRAVTAYTLTNDAGMSVTAFDLGATIQMETRVRYGTAIQRAVMAYQKRVMEETERLTGVPVRQVNVRVSGVIQ